MWFAVLVGSVAAFAFIAVWLALGLFLSPSRPMSREEREHLRRTVDEGQGVVTAVKAEAFVDHWQLEQQETEPPIQMLRMAFSALGYRDLTTVSGVIANKVTYRVPEHQRWPDARDITCPKTLRSLHYSKERREFYVLDQS